MELAAGVPLAVGATALRSLNSYLEDSRIAEAWYGKDYKTFAKRKWVKGKYSLCIGKVFVVREEDGEALIGSCLPVCHTWFRNRRDGECCWLTLYRTSKAFLGETIVVQDAQTALSWLGTVSSLPAAKMNAWCLSVMAYANGATPGMSTKDGGAFKVVLHARNFVLTIHRMSLNGQSVAHIEPREHPLPTATVLPDEAWKNLLRFGHTFTRDDGMAWPLYCNLETLVDPPPENSMGQWDDKLRNGFMDASVNKLGEERLRLAIHKLTWLWAKCCGDVGAYDHYKIAQDKRVMEEHRRYGEDGKLLPGKEPSKELAGVAMACYTMIKGRLDDVKAVLSDHKEREKVTRADVLRESEGALDQAGALLHSQLGTNGADTPNYFDCTNLSLRW